MELATFGRFKECIKEELLKKVPSVFHDEIPEIMATFNPFVCYMKVPLNGWEESVCVCANYMIVLSYGKDEEKKMCYEHMKQEGFI